MRTENQRLSETDDDDVLCRLTIVLAVESGRDRPLDTRPGVCARAAAAGGWRRVLGIVYLAISRHLIKTAGLTRASFEIGAMTLVQRLGSALNLNVHFHRLFPDGVYRRDPGGRVWFGRVSAPSPDELNCVVRSLAERLGRSLERSGLIGRDIENACLAFDPADEAPIRGLLGYSITYRIAAGFREGQGS